MIGPLIFSGNTVKSLKRIIDFFGNSQILSGTIDPTVTNLTATRGSLQLNTSNGLTYQKQDSGSSTNWVLLSTDSSTNINGGTPSSSYAFTQNLNGGSV